MWLEAIYHCTYIGGDPNYPEYHIGDRVMVPDNQLYSKWGTKLRANTPHLFFGSDDRFVNINGKIFDMDAFEVVDIAKERDEKIKRIIE